VRRPDILAAEHNLISANASIGAARAAFFPTVTLTGNYGTASSAVVGTLRSRLDGLDILAADQPADPRRQSPGRSLDLAKAQKNITIVQYEQAIQTAFREVADALAGRSTLDSQIAADQALLEATSEFVVGISGAAFRTSPVLRSSGMSLKSVPAEIPQSGSPRFSSKT
jgi:outer membrane protein, multidrug efflux system